MLGLTCNIIIFEVSKGKTNDKHILLNDYSSLHQKDKFIEQVKIKTYNQPVAVFKWCGSNSSTGR